MSKQYPKIFTSMDDVKYVIENFPKETWEEDMKDLLSKNYGWVILGRNPKVKPGKIVVDALFVDDVKKINEHTDEWGDMTQLNEDDDTTMVFKFRGDNILCEAGPLPYATANWVDQEYVLNHLYGFAEAQETLKAQAEQLKESMKDIVWVNDAGQEVDENEQVIKKMVDINSDDPFVGLSDAELLRLKGIFDKHFDAVAGQPTDTKVYMEKENDDEEL